MTRGHSAHALAGLTRATVAWALLVTALAGSLVEHNHSLFADGDATHAESRYLTRHNPHSRAKHWHAVLAVVHEHDCIACHTQRLAGLLIQRHDLEPGVSTKKASPVLRIESSTARLLPCGSRAPPTLL